MATQANILSDLSSVTKIPAKVLGDLITKENFCIGSAINSSIIAGESVAVLNIGIGTLSVDIPTKQCRFVPSRDLKSIIKRTIDGKVDPLELELEHAVIEKLMKLYGDVFGEGDDI